MTDMFKIEIIGIENFLAFVAIIRGEELDAEKMKSALEHLRASNATTQDAVDNANQTRKIT